MTLDELDFKYKLGFHNLNKNTKNSTNLELSGTLIFFPSCWAPMIDESSSTEPLLTCKNYKAHIRKLQNKIKLHVRSIWIMMSRLTSTVKSI